MPVRIETSSAHGGGRSERTRRHNRTNSKCISAARRTGLWTNYKPSAEPSDTRAFHDVLRSLPASRRLFSDNFSFSCSDWSLFLSFSTATSHPTSQNYPPYTHFVSNVSNVFTTIRFTATIHDMMSVKLMNLAALVPLLLYSAGDAAMAQSLSIVQNYTGNSLYVVPFALFA